MCVYIVRVCDRFDMVARNPPPPPPYLYSDILDLFNLNTSSNPLVDFFCSKREKSEQPSLFQFVTRPLHSLLFI